MTLGPWPPNAAPSSRRATADVVAAQLVARATADLAGTPAAASQAPHGATAKPRDGRGPSGDQLPAKVAAAPNAGAKAAAADGKEPSKMALVGTAVFDASPGGSTDVRVPAGSAATVAGRVTREVVPPAAPQLPIAAASLISAEVMWLPPAACKS